MLFYGGLFLILFISSVKICQAWLPGCLQSKILKKFLGIGNLDKIFRSMQYAGMYIVGDYKVTSALVCAPYEILVGNNWVNIIKEAERLKIFIRNFRKVIKFKRGLTIALNFWKKIELLQISEFRLRIFSIQALRLLQKLTKILGQACLVLFYMTDHHESFDVIGLLHSQPQIADSIGDFGINMRMWFSIFLVISISISIFNICFETINSNTKKSKLNRLLIMPFIELTAHVLDVFLFYGLVYKGFLSKKKLGILGITTALLRVTRIFSK